MAHSGWHLTACGVGVLERCAASDSAWVAAASWLVSAPLGRAPQDVAARARAFRVGTGLAAYAANLNGLGGSACSNGAPVPRARGRRVPLEAAGELGAQAEAPNGLRLGPPLGCNAGWFQVPPGQPGRPPQSSEQDRALDQPKLPGPASGGPARPLLPA
jgi:hypothetical protein